MTKITLLDGGIGQEIVTQGGEKPTPLWSTDVMLKKPGLVESVHRSYFGAGATVATTNSYALHRDRFARYGQDLDFETAVKTAVQEAVDAREAHGRGRVAGSIGPIGASYRADVVPPVSEAAPLIAELAGLLAKNVDFLICETVCSVLQAEGALEGCKDAGLPVWLSVTVDDEDGTLLRSGEPLGKLAEVIAKYQPEAVLANCARPEAIDEALDVLRAFGKPFGGYANGFVTISQAFLEDAPTVEALQARKDLSPAVYADFALGWVGKGATIIGGCCETRPAHIAEIARRLHRSGFEIV